jgi:SynChlorMet cassette protein ScmD
VIAKHFKPVANPSVVFREEFDDWAVLFDPDTGAAFGTNPVGAMIWKHSDGRHTIHDLMEVVLTNCVNVPEELEQHITEFIEDLKGRGMIGKEVTEG